MHCTFDLGQQARLVDQEGVTVGSPMLALFDPDGDEQRSVACAAGGDERTVEDLIDAYMDAAELAKGTRLSYLTTKRKWDAWRRFTLRSVRPKGANQVLAEDISEFLAWVYKQAVEAGDDNPGRSFNKRKKELHAVFAWAAKPSVGILRAIPVFPDDRKQRSVAGHYFLTDEEIERLYWATHRMHTPKGWSDPRAIGALWRCALVLFRNYGLDTQIIFPFTNRATSILTWGTVYTKDALPPGRVANCPNGDGWLVLRRQKTQRPLFLPLEAVSRAHLEAIRPAEAKQDDPVMGLAGGGKPCERFQELCDLAQLTPKWDPELQRPKDWEIKDLRKTAATVHDANIPGSARVVLGHSSGTITERHYANDLPMLVKALGTLPQPEAFRSILDPQIKPPVGVLLFAK